MKTTTTKCTKNHSGNHREIAGTTVRAWGAILPAYYADGQAHVWDSVAGYYTTCHSLTERQIARVRRLASRD